MTASCCLEFAVFRFNKEGCVRKRGVLVSCLPFALLAGLFLSGCHSTPDKAVSRHRRPGEPLHPPPVPAHIPLPREPQMGWPEAEITRKSGDIATPKNIFGVFERLDVGAAETLGIRVRWPRPIMGGHVAAEVNAAGYLDGRETSRLMKLDANGAIAFEYTASDYPGPCQVVLRAGSDETRLNFWVPPSK